MADFLSEIPIFEEEQTNDFAAQMMKLNEQNESVDKAKQEFLDEAVTDKKEQEKDQAKGTWDLIKEEAGLDDDYIEDLKAKYQGRVYAIYFEKGDWFIFRYITRAEWKDVRKHLASIPEATEDTLHEMVVQKCLLNPVLDTRLKAIIAGGTIETLYKQIMFASNFIPEAMAVSMITKL